MALARPAVGVVVLLGMAVVASASPLSSSAATPFLAAAASERQAAAAADPPPPQSLVDAPVAPPPAAAATAENIWDDYGAHPSETGAPADADAGDGAADAAEPTDEPVWDDYGGGSPYPPIEENIPELNDGAGTSMAGSEVQDPPADAFPDTPPCAALGAECHRLLRCCEEEEGVAACAVVPEGAEEHPTMGHCMRLVTG